MGKTLRFHEPRAREPEGEEIRPSILVTSLDETLLEENGVHAEKGDSERMNEGVAEGSGCRNTCGGETDAHWQRDNKTQLGPDADMALKL